MIERLLTVEEIEICAIGFKEDLQRAANRAVRRHDSNMAAAALEGMEYIDKFVYTLRMLAGSQLGQLARPARARPIHIPASVKEAGKKQARKAKKRGSKS